MIKKVAYISILAGLSINVQAELLIKTVFDGPLPGGLPKGIELVATDDIADLSLYGVGSANNGGGSDGQEFTFPDIELKSGNAIYLASEAQQFEAFFGFPPTYTSGTLVVNGDDALEVFFNNEVIDVFGDINVDGSGEAWEYLDGWASRTVLEANQGVFDLTDWVFSGPNALDGELINETASNPVPVQGQVDQTDPEDPIDQPITAQKISAIQGVSNSDNDASPLLGQKVVVEAVVIGDFQDGDADQSRNLRGFYLQEETVDQDDDPRSSEGLFVFDTDFGVDVNLGDVVRVTGEVAEFFGETQLSEITAVEVLQAGDVNALSQVSPAKIDLLASEAVTQNANGAYQPVLEAFEGMLVTFENQLTIIELFQLDRFNEIRLIAGERPVQFTQNNLPSIEGYQAHQKTAGSRTITYDDGLSEQNGSIDLLDGFAPYNEETAPRMGDVTHTLTGILSYQWAGNAASAATWRVRSHIDGANNFTSTLNGDSPNPRSLSAPEIEGNLKIASFNVLNLFKTLNAPNVQTAVGQNPRGANDLTRFGIEPATFEFERQLSKLVNAVVEMRADIVGLVELENDFDVVNDGSTAIEVFVNAINTALGRDIYDYVYPGSRFVGADAISVGFIYNKNAVSITDNTQVAMLDDSVAQQLPEFISHNFELDPIFNGPATNRISLAVTFTHLESDQSITVATNHFKSKGPSGLADTDSPNFDQQDGAAFWNDRRNNAAIALTSWLKTFPTGIQEDKVILLGDFNAYAQEDPIQTVVAQGFTNVEDEDAYSFVFNGQVGTLDYGFISDNLLDSFEGAAVWHINADEADALDYNVDFGRDTQYFNGDSAVRNSDHDPLIFGLELKAETQPVEITLLDIIPRFDTNLIEGSVKGHSHFSSWLAHLFKKKLLIAQSLINQERTRAACFWLDKAIAKSDGRSRPRDLVVGSGVQKINEDLMLLSKTLSCAEFNMRKTFW